eukprot:TRINITY_DN11722_c0_g1_i1.p1 TRINITY_DN11722_c0_g1~~TRINITY_DN11722_c0_g1_i1.p1  ORF type:complete len:273 (+),score=56.15 TRINITY_DN11722_c0_g1_i1:793-1611(+)
MTTYNFKTLEVTRDGGVLHVKINRPEKLNAMNKAFWSEMRDCFRQINADVECRAVVISGNGRLFTAGLDLMDMSLSPKGGDVSRKAWRLRELVLDMQESFTVMERCKQPVIAAIHNACIGGGIDLITACDIRYGSEDCFFSIKEVDIGLAADVGTLQRLPKVISNMGLIKELAYTARRFKATEAHQMGLLTAVFKDKDETVAHALKIAHDIAGKSPIAVMGTKVGLNYAVDHTVEDGLRQIAGWNSVMLQSPDVMQAARAHMTKKKPSFAKL